MSRTYETLVILHPDLAGDELTAMVEKVQGILTQQDAEIVKADNWGSRKLAYMINKQARGTYLLLVYTAAAEVIAEFERRLRIDEGVLKYQTVMLEGGYQEPEVVEAAPAAEETDVEDETAEA